jgi:methylmalonyl-CoA mutase N-terminal domain/subunit
LIANETGVADTVDPLAGSYFIESLTRGICDSAEEYIKKIDEIGGAVSAIEQGYIQREIQDSAYKYQREIEQEERVVVGLNKFQVEEEKPTNLLRVDPAVRVDQVQSLKKLKSERDDEKAKRSLADLKQRAEGSANLLPLILEAVKTYATLGEICDVLRGVFGEYQQVSTLGS